MHLNYEPNIEQDDYEWDDLARGWSKWGQQALHDVAEWLSYKGSEDYNQACSRDPDDVRRRLREAV